MEEFIEYIKNTFDESTIKTINFINNSNLLTWNLKEVRGNEDGKNVTKFLPNLVEFSYLKLCDPKTSFKHDILGELFIHYIKYVLNDSRADWQIDLNKLKTDLEIKCEYCNIKNKYCPMKVLAYIKKCIYDEKFNEAAVFNALIQEEEIPRNQEKEKEIAEKILKITNNSIDLKGASYLLETKAVEIKDVKENIVNYRNLDFYIDNVSFINNIYDYFIENKGKEGNLDLNNLNFIRNYSYMFDFSPIELSAYIKYLCDLENVDFYYVFEQIDKTLGKINYERTAYYKEYLNKIDSEIYRNDEAKTKLKEIFTYIKNYSENIKLPYIKFDFLIYIQNNKKLDRIVNLISRYFRTFSYLSNKNVKFVDVEMFIRKTKDNYDVNYQLNRLYLENDLIVFSNFEKAGYVNEYRFDTFFKVIESIYDLNKKSITIFAGSKDELNPIITKYKKLSKYILRNVLEFESANVDEIKKDIFSNTETIVDCDEKTKVQIENYIDENYLKNQTDEEEFIKLVKDKMVFEKYKVNCNDEETSKNLGFSKRETHLEEHLKELDELVGLTEVKYRVKEIMKYANFQKEIGQKDDFNLNMLFKGNTGTGKTEVAKIISKILFDLGMLRTEKVITVAGKDMIGEHLGQTAPKTQAIIDSALDGVLVIDEAQTILTSKGSADYPGECISTIALNIDKYKGRLVIIFSGKNKEMSVFKTKYPEISSRIGFDLEFENFTTEQLIEIFKRKIAKKEITLEDGVIEKIEYLINKARLNKNFGNARYIDWLIEKLLMTHSMNCDSSNLKIISNSDVVKMKKIINDDTKSLDSVLKNLNSLIGLEKIKEIINGFANVLEFNKKIDRQNDFNMHMIFKGNAGTGKTTVARIIADIYYSLGYIKKNKVVEVQSQDLIAEWLGQTAPKTQAVIDSALDGVLFIDEAYSLMEHKGSSSNYTSECIATLLKAMEDYKDRLIVIFAGYKDEMTEFRDLNPGLKSRIGFEIEFEDYTVDELVQIFNKKALDQKYQLGEGVLERVKEVVTEAKRVENFGNGRFIDNLLQKTIIEHALRLKDEFDKEKLLLIIKDDVVDYTPEASKRRIGF